MTSGKEVPFYATGKRVYFKRAELIDWVTRRRVASRTEIEQEAINHVTINRRKR